jgi:hypothetical protein
MYFCFMSCLDVTEKIVAFSLTSARGHTHKHCNRNQGGLTVIFMSQVDRAMPWRNVRQYAGVLEKALETRNTTGTEQSVNGIK